MYSPSRKFTDELRQRMEAHGFDPESLARKAGVSDTNVLALLDGYWNPHIGKAVCEILGVPIPTADGD